MRTETAAANPFVLMLDPQAVFAAIERSNRLSRLESRICRPLDKPLPVPGGEPATAFDAEVDRAAEASD